MGRRTVIPLPKGERTKGGKEMRLRGEKGRSCRGVLHRRPLLTSYTKFYQGVVGVETGSGYEQGDGGKTSFEGFSALGQEGDRRCRIRGGRNTDHEGNDTTRSCPSGEKWRENTAGRIGPKKTSGSECLYFLVLGRAKRIS